MSNPIVYTGLSSTCRDNNDILQLYMPRNASFSSIKVPSR